MKKILLSLLLLFAFSNIAFAKDKENSSQFSIFAGAGKKSYNFPTGEESGKAGVFGLKFYGKGLDNSGSLFELSYVAFPTVEKTTYKLETGMLPIMFGYHMASPEMPIYLDAKIGFARTNYKATKLTESKEESKFNFAYGLNAGAKINRHFFVEGGFEKVSGNRIDYVDMDNPFGLFHINIGFAF